MDVVGHVGCDVRDGVECKGVGAHSVVLSSNWGDRAVLVLLWPREVDAGVALAVGGDCGSQPSSAEDFRTGGASRRPRKSILYFYMNAEAIDMAANPDRMHSSPHGQDPRRSAVGL